MAPTCAVAKLHSRGLTSFLTRRNLYFYECGEVTKAFSFTFLKLYSLVSRLICVYVRARTSNDNKRELNQSSVLY